MHVLFLSSHPMGERAARFTWEIQDDHDFMWYIGDEKFDFQDDQYDLGVSFLYNHLIPAEQLKDRIWINFHPAPLPEYRGRNVAYHAVMNKETVFGATIHYVDSTFDTGDIIQVLYFELNWNETAGEIAARARECCLSLFKQYIPRFIYGQKPMGFRQLGGTYYKKESIDPNISLTSEQQQKVRAVTAPPHYAETTIGGVTYVIAPKSELHHPDHESSGDAQANADETL